MKTSKYFSEAEFRKCSPPCERNDMDQSFLNLMDKVREKAGIPLLMSSAYRTSQWDRQKNRSGDGAHTYGIAVDFVCNNSATRKKIINACLECGVTRIGIEGSFIHIDDAGRNRIFESHVTKGKKIKFQDNIIWTY